MEVKKIAEEWEILKEEETAAKSEEEARKIVPSRFYKWIKIFGKKASKRILVKKMEDYTIKLKEGFMPRKENIYPLSKEEKGEVQEFIKEQLRKGYIGPSKLLQMAPVFFVEKKDGKK